MKAKIFNILDESILASITNKCSEESAIVTFCADIDCTVFCDGIRLLTLDANNRKDCRLKYGEHILEFVSNENNKTRIERLVKILECDKPYSAEIKMLTETIDNYVIYAYKGYNDRLRKWAGPMVNGMPNGYGKITWEEDNIEYEYLGEVVNGIEHGNGCFLNINKSKDKFSGITRPSRYELKVGNWEKGEINYKKELHLCQYDNGDWVENNTVMNAKSSCRVNIFPSEKVLSYLDESTIWSFIEVQEYSGKARNLKGDTFEGAFDGISSPCHGVISYRNGDVYEGYLREIYSDIGGYGICEGKMKYSNGDVYEGEFENNMRHGSGKMTYANGDVYEGEWDYDTLTELS